MISNHTGLPVGPYSVALLGGVGLCIGALYRNRGMQCTVDTLITAVDNRSTLTTVSSGLRSRGEASFSAC